jgi:hypothetical protein
MAEPGDLADLASALRAVTTDETVRERLSAGASRRGAMLPTWRESADRFFSSIRAFLQDGVP